MYLKLPLIYATRPSHVDFLTAGLVWHPSCFPWFHVSVKVLSRDDRGRHEDQILMVSSYDRLKEIMSQENKLFRIKAISYVTPGDMNGSGQWQIEPLIEIIDLANDGGWSIPRCKVTDKRVYRGFSLEPVPEFWSERVIYRHDKPRRTRANRL
ncbi:hypothetical protein [Pseudomonas syringae]|uniref:hypothetical protein n=1 Tax=Pseudomonas syringae TaxID=317 RepID=UPI003F853249